VSADSSLLSPASTVPGRSAARRSLTLLGIVVLAINLRPAVSSLGISLGDVGESLGFSGSTAGLLTTLPVLCFAGVGAATTALTRRFGVHRSVLLATGMVAAGLLARGLTASTLVFLLASTVALSGIAVANVALPHLVKLHFPDHIAGVAGLYSALLMAGAFLPSVVTVPLDDAAGTWRAGLLVWAGVAFLAILPWLALARHEVRADLSVHGRVHVSMLLRSRLAWSLAIFCGLQSAMAYTQFGWLTQIYQDAGLTQQHASLLLGLLALIGIPLPLVLPWLFRHIHDHRVFVIAFSLCGTAGFTGLWLAPATVPALWAALMGLGGCAFPYVLTMIGMRARTPDATAVLSGFVQSLSYLIAAIGPFAAGVLNEATGEWDIPLAVLAGLGLPMMVAGLGFAREQYIEDEVLR
jgi:CP family cyanate transporter-like MFS transporter